MMSVASLADSGLTLSEAPASGDLRAALAAAHLPTDDLDDPDRVWFVARRGGRIVAHAGLEPYGDIALLRSVVVMHGEQGRGYGSALVAALCAEATRRGIRTLFLLTTSADPFFARLGFARIARADVPPAVAASREFASLCPGTAQVMRKSLDA
jgi:N-acetylglutamate synthase-like GNAT family acetyltransferase